MNEEKKEWVPVVFILASGFILLFNLWGRSLENHDYLRYAEIVREMIRSGDWVVPRLNGEIYIDKPPLLFWLMAIPSQIYGSVTPWTARLPSALAAWIGVVVLFRWARRMYGTVESGLVCGGILLTSYQYFFEARSAKTDMLLCLMVLLSLYFFRLGYEGDRRKAFLFSGLSFFFMGLGALTKGPFGVAFPMLVVAVFLTIRRRIRIFWSKPFLLGYVILAMTVLPWIAGFVGSVGWDQTLDLVKGNQILTRRAPVTFYVTEIWPQFSPWSLLLPFACVGLWRRRSGALDAGESFPVIWFLTLLVALTLFKYRASRYLLPLLPPFALMIGGILRGKRFSFLFSFLCLLVLIWHGVEFYTLSRDPFRSPGRVLAAELRPIPGSSAFYGYRLDISTLEELNFYLDRVIPVVKKGETLPENKMILMPKKVYQQLRRAGSDSISTVREFEYKEENLVLVSS